MRWLTAQNNRTLREDRKTVKHLPQKRIHLHVGLLSTTDSILGETNIFYGNCASARFCDTIERRQRAASSNRQMEHRPRRPNREARFCVLRGIIPGRDAVNIWDRLRLCLAHSVAK